MGEGGTERAGQRLLWVATGKCKGPEAGLSLLSSRIAGIPRVRAEGGRGRMGPLRGVRSVGILLSVKGATAGLKQDANESLNLIS